MVSEQNRFREFLLVGIWEKDCRYTFFLSSEAIHADRKTIEIFSNRGFFPVYDSGNLVNGFALAHRKDQRLRLTLKGEGVDEQKIRDFVTSLGISEVVSFRQKLSTAKSRTTTGILISLSSLHDRMIRPSPFSKRWQWGFPASQRMSGEFPNG